MGACNTTWRNGRDVYGKLLRPYVFAGHAGLVGDAVPGALTAAPADDGNAIVVLDPARDV